MRVTDSVLCGSGSPGGPTRGPVPRGSGPSSQVWRGTSPKVPPCPCPRAWLLSLSLCRPPFGHHPLRGSVGTQPLPEPVDKDQLQPRWTIGEGGAPPQPVLFLSPSPSSTWGTVTWRRCGPPCVCLIIGGGVPKSYAFPAHTHIAGNNAL